jgi:ribonuclease HII
VDPGLRLKTGSPAATDSSTPVFPVPPEMLHWECLYASRGEVPVAGLDEAGRGPLAGPVVAAAVILPPEDCYPVALIDSKKLTPARREAAFEFLRDLPGSAIGVGIVEAEEIDRINILQATRKAMLAALAALRVAPLAILIDAVFLPGLQIPQQNLVRGEEASVSIAAASIVAKVTRDRIMVEADRHHPVYGFARHKGYGTPQHLTALKEHGPSPIHRQTFRPVRECAPRS